MRVKLHQEGIHSLTIQPEFCKASKHCIMTCPSTECRTKVCCEITTDPLQVCAVTNFYFDLKPPSLLQRKTSPQSAVEEMKNTEEQIEISECCVKLFRKRLCLITNCFTAVTENRSSICDETIAGVASYPDRETIL